MSILVKKIGFRLLIQIIKTNEKSVIYNLENKLLYFHFPSKTDRGTEYAYKAKDFILFFD